MYPSLLASSADVRRAVTSGALLLVEALPDISAQLVDRDFACGDKSFDFGRHRQIMLHEF
ncbi:hypothetical protein PVW51_09645 [Sulfitobacter sp. PR48]|uniref:hypothetical protein n=1 Tax=Sulfitobacter sp. PR48 TaxID=3028383 RepID=UPI00237B8E2E|nr:hypothetical protein [Sulfitobacter sp. PR48]MDD9720957.1 hypothetical protein [Sulfitobacter sp. PR48]